MKTLRTKRLLIGVLALIMVVSAVFVTLSFINTSSAKAEGDISYTHSGAGAQDHLTRYLITVNASVDVGGSKDIGFEVTKNGVSVGNKTFNIYKASSSSSYFLIDYGTLTGNNAITSASEITDTYVVTLKKDTAVGSYKVADDVIYKINRDSITLLNKITYTHSDAGAQDNLSRYLITVNASVDVGGSKDIGFEVTKNGESIGNKAFTVWRENASTSYFLINYGTLTGDNAITTASGVTDEYIVTLKKGTLVGNFYVAQDISYYIKGDTAKLYKGDISYTHSSASAQDGELARYLVTVNASVDVGGSKDISFAVTKNGESIGNKAFTVWRENETTTYFLFNYKTLTGDDNVTTASQVTDLYEVTLKKGTFVGSYIVSNDVTYYMRGSTITNELKGEVTYATSETGAQDNLGRYLVTVNASVDVGVKPEVYFEVYKNGQFDGNKKFTIWRESETITYFLFNYKTLTGDDNVTTASQITDLYEVTLKKGTFVGSYIVSNDVTYYMRGSTITNELKGEVTYSNSETGAQDNLGRYLATLSASVDVGGHKDISFAVTKNGESIGNKVFTIWRENETISYFLFTYETLTGDGNVTTASQVTDLYEVTLKKGTFIGRYIVSNDVTYLISRSGITYLPNAGTELNLVNNSVSACEKATESRLNFIVLLNTDMAIGSGVFTAKLYDYDEKLSETGGYNLYSKENGFGNNYKDVIVEVQKVSNEDTSQFYLVIYCNDIENEITDISEFGKHKIVIDAGTQYGVYKFAEGMIFDVDSTSIVYTNPEVLVEHSLSINKYDDTHGKVTLNKTSAFADTEITMNFTIEYGYEVSYITINGEKQTLMDRLVSTGENSYEFKFSMPVTDVEIDVDFVRAVATVNNDNVGVTVTVGDGIAFFIGETYSFSFTVDTGFKGENIKVYFNNQLLEANQDGVYSFVMEKTNDIKIEGVSAIKYTIKFMDGDTILETVTVDFNGKVSKPSNPTKTDYEFVGWFNADTEFDFNTVITNDYTLSARFNKVEKQKDASGCSSSILLYSDVVVVMIAIAVCCVVFLSKKSKQ